MMSGASGDGASTLEKHFQIDLECSQRFQDQAKLHRLLAFFKMADPEAAHVRFFSQLSLRPPTLFPLVPNEFTDHANCLNPHGQMVTTAYARMQQ